MLFSPNFQTAKIHELLFRLDQRITITTNIDPIYDNFLHRETQGNTRIVKFCDAGAAAFIRNSHNHLIKMHGCVTAPNNIIFSQNEYASARLKYGDFYTAIGALFLSNTLVFVGSGLSDPDIKLLLENNQINLPGMPPHYMISPTKFHTDELAALEDSRNLKLLSYSSADNHSELIESFQELVQRLP